MKAWWYGSRNWGDNLTPVLMRRLGGLTPKRQGGPGTLLAVGSIMHAAQPGDTVWGTGSFPVATRPLRGLRGLDVRAVRGPRTAVALREAGAEVPGVFGDPGVLVSRLFADEVEPEYALGVIPHMVEREIVRPMTPPGALFIDICGAFEDVVAQARRCRAIASSSLHGIVLAESFGIDAAWLAVDGARRLVGGHYKFIDYFEGTDREGAASRVAAGERIDPEKLIWLPPLAVAEVGDRLLRACPFPLKGGILPG